MFKRIILFMTVNLAVVLTISLVTSLLGVNRYITAQGLDYNLLLGFCLIWGFAGAFISLALSKVIAKWTMKIQIIEPNNPNPELRALVQTVYRLAKSAGLKTMPEVGIYQSQEVNAFATGPTKNSSLVAISSGLLQFMSADEVEGVLGHEIAHVANGDMVTMTLLQGVINAFVMFLARIIAFSMKGDRKEMNYMVVFLLEIVLSLIGMIIVSYFSRMREFRADAGGARFAGRDKMIHALQKLSRTQELVEPGHKSLATLKIAGGKYFALLATHPSLEDRIARLQGGR
jgi:heat shock protein HtpX